MYHANAINALIEYASKHEGVRQGKRAFAVKDVIPNDEPKRKINNFSLILQVSLRQVLHTLDALGFARCHGITGFYELNEKGYDFLVERIGRK